MLRPLCFLLVLAMTAFVPLAASDAYGGECWGEPALGIVEIGDGTAAHTFYVDDRNYLLGNGVWTYEETNGVFAPHDAVSVHDPGAPHVMYWWVWVESALAVNTGGAGDLQRGGSSPIVPDDSDICTDACGCPPDTLIL